MINIKDDSRKVVPGDTFIALRGILSDGHSYIETAIKNGATKIIAEEGSYSVPTVIVPDTHKYLITYLHDNYWDTLKDMRFIGITGTNGKTTCAFLIHNILNDLGEKSAYIGTIGFYIVDRIHRLDNTTPDLILIYNMLLEAKEKGCKNVVMELSSQGLAYERVEGLEFDFAAFTNLTQDHLDYHITMENYALAKQMLFKKLRSGGKAIVNSDDSFKDYFLLPENNNITYGLTSGDYQITDYELTSQRTNFTYTYKGESYKTSTKLIGEYNLYNLLLVIAVIHEIGYSHIENYIKDVKAPPGRMQMIDFKEATIIVDYAHTPDAIEKIIEIVKKVLKGNLYVVYGCGGDRDRGKRPIMTKMITEVATLAILTHEDPRTEDEDQIFNDMISGATSDRYVVIKDRVLAIKTGMDLLKKDDMLLILGKGHEDSIIMNGYKVPFNDYETVLKYLKECE